MTVPVIAPSASVRFTARRLTETSAVQFFADPRLEDFMTLVETGDMLGAMLEYQIAMSSSLEESQVAAQIASLLP